MEADCILPSNYFDDERIDLTDVVRKKNTNKKSITYESVAQKLKSRIEFFWLPNLSPVKSLKWIQKLQYPWTIKLLNYASAS